MTTPAKIYIKYCPVSNTESLVEWWLSESNCFTVRVANDDTQIYSYQYSAQSNQLLSNWICQGFSIGFEDSKNDSIVEVYSLVSEGNMVDWFRLNSTNPVAQNILRSLPSPATYPSIRTKSNHSKPQIFGAVSLIFTYLFIWGTYVLEWIKREFQDTPAPIKYSNILACLIIIVPILYLVFFCTKNKAKKVTCLVAASLAVIRQLFQLLEHPNLSACVYLAAASCFLLSVLFVQLCKEKSTNFVACSAAVIPVVLTIIGIAVSDWDGFYLMLISTTLFIVSALLYLVQTTKSAQ